MVNDDSLIKELCEKNIQLNNGKHRLITIFLHNQNAYAKLRQEGKVSPEAHICLRDCRSRFEKAESEVSIDCFIVAKYKEIIREYNSGHTSKNPNNKNTYKPPYARLREDYGSGSVDSLEMKLKKDEEEKEKQRREAEQKERERYQMEETKKQEYLSGFPVIGAEAFLLRSNTFRCNHNNHNIKDIDAVVTIVSRKRDEFNTRLYRISAGYCRECNVYFILESAYERLRSAGIPICRVADRDKYFKSVQNNGMRLADESILMQYGYNVNQNEGLTDQTRHKILAMLIDNKIMSKSAIVSYLDFFINQRQSNPIYDLAISKWAKDRDFVNEYRFGEYGLYVIDEIQK